MSVQFGPYVLEERIACGGMAEVWRAQRAADDGKPRRCVVKRILPAYASDGRRVAKFLEEARISASLRHSNIVPVFDFGEQDGAPFLAMEYVAGKDLDAVLARAAQRNLAVPVAVATHIAVETCRALAFAHGAKGTDGRPLGLVHRDVSPSNVLLSFDGRVQLADFGIARLEAKATQTDARTLRGKVRYMSPEQARLEAVDARTDLFAIGAVLYEMLAGRPAFDATDDVAALERVRSGLVPSVRALRPEVPAALDETLRVALAKDRAARFPDARTMGLALAMAAPTSERDDVAAWLASLFPEEARRGSVEQAATVAGMDPLGRALLAESGVEIPTTRDGGAARTSGAPATAKTAGRFVLLDRLGQGGMGEVFRGRDARGVEAAVKLLHAHLVDDQIVRRFEREGLARIEHPNVVRIFETGRCSTGALYIAMELLDGEDMGARLDHSALAPGEAVAIGVEAAAGLQAVHTSGLVHRDVKPQNILLCRNGSLKLLDFGIAIRPSMDTRMTRQGFIVGTPSYLAPEQARGAGEVDARADVWALGAVLYHALSGRPPFERDSDLATLVAVLYEELVPLSVACPDVPPSLAAAIERALARRPVDRWQSAEAFAQALKACDLTVRPSTPPRTAELPEVGEVRVVSVVLFAGLLDADEAERTVRAVGGAWQPLLGDHAIGVFGAEISEGDEPVRAARAALTARAAARTVAVATGRAALGPGAVVGEAVRRADEGCRLNRDPVVVDDATRRSLPDDLSCEPLVDGFAELSPLRTRPRRRGGTDSPDTPLVGRAVETAQIAQAIRRAFEDRATILLCTGPAGIGKSRLRQEVQALLERERDVSILFARAEPRGWSSGGRPSASWAGGAPLLVDAAVSGGAYDRSASLDERRGALRSLTTRLIPDAPRAAECAEALGEVLGARFPDSPRLAAARADPEVMTDRLRMALGDVFEGLCVAGPVALVLEDLQWADALSLRLVDELCDRFVDRRFFVFGTARPELLDEHPTIFSDRDAIRVDLRGLSSAEVAAIAGHAAGAPLRDDVARALAERTAGNPFFVEQIVLDLRDRGGLDVSATGLPLPMTVEAAVQARLDHLPRPEKEASKRAAVFGRTFWVDGLGALGVPDPNRTLEGLQKREIVSARARSRLSGQREYQFRSGVVAEVAYNLLPDDTRATLHEAAAAFLERRPEAGAEEIATHFERAGRTAQASERYARAVLAAAARGDTEGVVRCSARALDLGVPADLLFSLHSARADAFRHLGDAASEGGELERALAFATAPAERAKALSSRAAVLSRSGRSDLAIEAAEKAVEAARESGDPESLAIARANEAVTLALAGRIAEATSLLAEVTSIARACSAPTRARAFGWRAIVFSLAGDLGASRDAYVDALEAFREAGDVRRVVQAEANLADCYIRTWQLADAEAALRSALESCVRVRNRKTERYVKANLGYVLAAVGRQGEALLMLAEAEQLAGAARDSRLVTVIGVYRAFAHLEADPERARAVADETANTAELRGLPAWSALALAFSSAARLRLDDRIGALERSTRAMAIRDALGGLEENEGDVFVAQAAALAASGRVDEAARISERGRARLVELAERIADPVWRDRFLHGPPAHRRLLGSGDGGPR